MALPARSDRPEHRENLNGDDRNGQNPTNIRDTRPLIRKIENFDLAREQKTPPK